MTYDQISQLQQSVDTLSLLCTKCPMMTLLWMQYNADTTELLERLTQDAASALNTRLKMLELALNKFPGSAIFNIHYLEQGAPLATLEDLHTIEHGGHYESKTYSALVILARMKLTCWP
jgi:hypothetical protein